MSLQTDISLGLKKESVFGTPVVVDHFPEILGDESLNWQPKFGQGQGMRVGATHARSARNALLSQLAGGDFSVELATKGMGILFEAALGSGVSTALTAPAYQQLFTPATNDFLPSYTLQKGLPLLGGAQQAHTFPGAMCTALELTAATEDFVKVKTTWTAREVQTGIALAAPAYPAGLELLTFVHGAITIGGSVTVPTATTLGSGGTPVANIKDFSLSHGNNLDGAGMNFGSAGKLARRKALGLRSTTGKVTAEYDSNTMRDAYLARTPLALTMTFKSLVPLTGSIYPTVQIVCPDIRLDSDLPTANGGDVIATPIDFTAFDGLVAASALYVAIITSDTAI